MPSRRSRADQHKEFLGHLSGSYSEPALTIHYRAEGRNEYTVLLYIPGERPFDLFDPERRGRQKLYVKRVYITDDAELLPPYLRFVRGIVDSEDMPLNLSREMLQNNPQVAAIRKAVTNKVLGELKKAAENDEPAFRKIWEAFGPVIKEGLYEDMERRDQLFEVARFRSTKGDWVSLKDYVSRLKENQTAIYYLTAEDQSKAASSPQLEGYKARDVEVLLLTDPVDSFWVRTALGFEGKPFKSVTQGAADLDNIAVKDDAAKSEADPGETATLIAAMKQALGERVQDVRGVQAADRQRRLPGGRRHDGPHAGEAAVAPEGLRCLGERSHPRDQSGPSADRGAGADGEGKGRSFRRGCQPAAAGPGLRHRGRAGSRSRRLRAAPGRGHVEGLRLICDAPATVRSNFVRALPPCGRVCY